MVLQITENPLIQKKVPDILDKRALYIQQPNLPPTLQNGRLDM